MYNIIECFLKSKIYQNGGYKNMDMHKWNIKNSEGIIIDHVITFTKSMFIASEKIKFKYGKNSNFLKLEYAGVYKNDK